MRFTETFSTFVSDKSTYMFFRLNIDTILQAIIEKDLEITSFKWPTLEIDSVVQAMGVNRNELTAFLDSKGICHTQEKIDYNALPDLKKWYLKKMRRYVRNSMLFGLEPGSFDEITFFQFCDKFHKFGHEVVRSWDDIDEVLLLQDFETRCFGIVSLGIKERYTEGILLDRVLKSFLFRLRIKKVPAKKLFQNKTIISFILNNRYHIFTSEPDSFAEATNINADMAELLKFNPPRNKDKGIYSLA